MINIFIERITSQITAVLYMAGRRGAVRLANYDIYNVDFAVRVTLTRHIKMDHNCNYNKCTKKILVIKQAKGSYFLRQILIPPNMTGFWN